MPLNNKSSNININELNDIADVNAGSPNDQDALVWDAATEKWIPVAGGAGGETNTASNVGTGGVGVFKQKNGTDLEFKKLNAGSNKVTITDDTSDNEVDIDIVPANISHTGLADIGTNTHAQIDTHIADTTIHFTIGSVDTDDLSEGITNKYFTEERVDDRVATLIQDGTNIAWTYDDVSNTLTGNVSGIPTDTDDLTEGSTNLYFTAERVDDRVAALIQNGTGISWTYDDVSNTLTANVSITQYTDEMAQDAVGGILTDSSTIDFTYDDVSNTITASTIDSAIDHNALLNYSVDQHRTINDAGTATTDLWSADKISTELAGKSDTTHNHDADYADISHTHTASEVTDFDTEVSNNTDVAAATTHIANTSNPHSVTKAQVGLGNVQDILSKFDATVDPTVNEDSGDGYSVGSTWVNVTDDKTFVCVDASVGAAVWNQVDAAGGGGSAYFDDDGGTPTVAPSATGTGSIAIGDGVTASGANSLAFGSATASSSGTSTIVASGPQSIAIGGVTNSTTSNISTTATADGAIAIGGTVGFKNGAQALAKGAIAIGSNSSGNNAGPVAGSASTTGVSAIAIGSGYTGGDGAWTSTANTAIAIGGASSSGRGARSSGSGSVAIGGGEGGTDGANASSTSAVAISNGATASQTAAVAIGKNTVASGSGSVAIGSNGANRAQATNTGAVAIGYDVTASGQGSIAIGSNVSGIATTTASGTSSIALGLAANATQSSAIALGSRAQATIGLMFAQSGAIFSATGDFQFARYLQKATTTDDTQTELGSFGSPGTTASMVLSSGQAFAFHGLVVGKTSSGDVGAYEITGAIKNNSGTTSLVGTPTVTVLGEDDANWDVAVEADDTNDRLAIKVTGVAATTINWGAEIQMMQIIT